MNVHRAGFGKLAWLAGVAVLGLMMAPWAVRAEDKGKATSPETKEKAEAGKKAGKDDGAKKEEIEKAQAEVKERMKQMQEDGEKLGEAIRHLAELRGGRPAMPIMPAMPAMPAMPWPWPGWGMPLAPPGLLPGRDRIAELEKKVDKLAKELEELKKEVKK